MSVKIPDFREKFSVFFEPPLLDELEEKSMLMEVDAGNTMLNIGQTVRAIPLVLKGTFKVSRVNDEGQELLLYYVKAGESCAMTFNSCLMTQTSVIKATAEEDSVLLCVPVKLMDEWLIKYPSWKRYVMDNIFNRFIELIKSFDDVAFKKMDERLLKYLREKSKAMVLRLSILRISKSQTSWVLTV